MENQTAPENPPIFNLPPVIGAVALALIGAHIIRVWLVPEIYEQDFLLLFAGIPARYGPLADQLPYSFAAIYTPLSHAFVHGDWGHLFINVLWMLAFGSPVAKRFGTVRFLALAFVGAIAGFGFHLASHLNDFGPMVGASGAVSAFMGAAIRLDRDVTKPVLGLKESFKNRGFLAFIGVWLFINLLVGLEPGILTGDVSGGGSQIAWQAHMGGFLVGLFGFSLFDPKIKPAPTFDLENDTD